MHSAHGEHKTRRNVAVLSCSLYGSVCDTMQLLSVTVKLLINSSACGQDMMSVHVDPI